MSYCKVDNFNIKIGMYDDDMNKLTMYLILKIENIIFDGFTKPTAFSEDENDDEKMNKHSIKNIDELKKNSILGVKSLHLRKIFKTQIFMIYRGKSIKNDSLEKETDTHLSW